MSNRVLYDSPDDPNYPFLVGPYVPDYDNEARVGMYRANVRCRADAILSGFAPILPLGSLGPHGGFLVEISDFTKKECGFIDWTYLYSFVPESRKVSETVSYNYQAIKDGEILEFPFVTTGYIQYDYFNNVPPSQIPVLMAYKVVKIGDAFWWLGAPAGEGKTSFIAGDSRVRLWRGLIYERATPYATVPNFQPL